MFITGIFIVVFSIALLLCLVLYHLITISRITNLILKEAIEMKTQDKGLLQTVTDLTAAINERNERDAAAQKTLQDSIDALIAQGNPDNSDVIANLKSLIDTENADLPPVTTPPVENPPVELPPTEIAPETTLETTPETTPDDLQPLV